MSKREYMTALEHVLADYEDQYMGWLEDEGLPMGEGTALSFLAEMEEDMEMSEW